MVIARRDHVLIMQFDLLFMVMLLMKLVKKIIENTVCEMRKFKCDVSMLVQEKHQAKLVVLRSQIFVVVPS